MSELTGNDYVSLLSIGRDASIGGVSVLHAGLGGLVEWAGPGADDALLRLQLTLDGERVDLQKATWRRLDRWIPSFQLSLPDGITVTGTICAPGGYPAGRGFFIAFEVVNGGRTPREIVLALDIRWTRTLIRIASGRTLPAANHIFATDEGICLESEAGPALAVAAVPRASAAIGDAPHGTGGVRRPNGEPLNARIVQTVRAEPQRRSTATLFVGLGRERDAAIAAAATLRRSGADTLVRQARLELSHMIRPGQDPRLGDLLNRNLIFNRYFATARAIDDDRLYLLRSRSSQCPGPALVNEREALFWTLPALILADPGMAREALFRTLETFSERSGEYLRCIDGGAFDTGFALDQLLLYPWAIEYYRTATGDDSVLDEPLVRQVLAEADAALFHRLHPRHMLCSTELLPSGEPSDHPFTTFGNVLLRGFADALPRLWTPTPGEPPLRLDGTAAEIAAAIWQHCTTEVDGVVILASSSGLDGTAAVYDDPSGSLALLPFLGFCSPDDPVWRDTMEFLRSSRYPLWRDGAVPGLASRSDPARARLAALCADLLGPGMADALRRLQQIRFTDGIAAACYDPGDGDVAQPHHAALAGLLAWSLVHALERGREPAGRRQRRRP